ncbi:hypothetical protein [Acidomonas methanolica]|uniref:Uncharacterized protein n=1 Tax=Acidomonas methanolica NBRC 104435 TaxID=1231351 RepID=A0A023D119_ACIMT|nr:hypothetical protein [Acidomonas methanolica]MBU2653422.1 hypothetical protein [Acidomonas methanolica]TCS32374.1 hypothetical protein EDC31_101314 [Acidomonas methanolica]GAJ27749.1 hypothetical protein Amme_005_137 [Acidomonas methanolica NBRC 104435]GBQ56827.1 hypothetical protein AA0498_2436 [Acidomonas methanolica]GEK97811.1 hypothetical protein AME01nite_03100 [Acidomonas methanolica NBRC 104435]
MPRLLPAAGLAVLAAILPVSARAQIPDQAPNQAQEQPPQLSEQMRADLAQGMAYRLPDDFFPRARATLQALQASGIQPPDSTGMSLNQTITAMDSIPGLQNILAMHGFTTETFVMGITAFGMTLAATNGQKLPAGFPAPNPANIALFKSHPQDVTALMQAMGTPPGNGEQTAQ